MTPDGVRGFNPTMFSRFFYLLAKAEGKDRRGRSSEYKLKLTTTGVVYDLGKGVGKVKVLGLADTGALGWAGGPAGVMPAHGELATGGVRWLARGGACVPALWLAGSWDGAR